ncbi:MAG: glycosyltransferase family 4 protein [Castellaniella sp.]|uniref:glycosyltransferase family 4 protein n=1 Tax=Castellaniella sp. TaxID=1955812 RepID=UPI003C725BD8
MKSLHVLHSEAATGWGGQENRIFKEMCAMRTAGHHMEALCQPHARLAQCLRDEGFQVHTLLMDGPRNYFRGVYRVRRLLRAGHFDVLNTHSRRDTLLAGVAGRLAGTPLIVRTRHLAVKPGSLLSYTGVPHRVIAISEYVRRLLLDRRVDPARVETIYTAIPLSSVVECSSLRHELGVPADAIVVGCVAVMRDKKGHRALIDAMAASLLRRPDVFLVLVGDGSPLLEELRAYVRARGLQDKVLFTGRRSDIPNVLAGFDIFALATEQEALGTSFIEAGAAGLPVVGTDVGGVPEVIAHGVTGLLVPVHDQDALENAIRTLVENPARRCSMGRAGMRAVRGSDRFTAEGMVRRTEQCYSRWLKERMQ